VAGEMGVLINKNDKGYAVYLNRYQAMLVLFQREHVEKLINMKENHYIKFLEYKHAGNIDSFSTSRHTAICLE
jgi:hypothetical protein